RDAAARGAGTGERRAAGQRAERLGALEPLGNLSRCQAKPADLFGAQFPPSSHLELRVPDRSDCDAAQLGHWMTDRLAHVSHLSIAPLADRDDKRDVARLAAVWQHLDLGGLGFSSLDRDPAREPIEIVSVRDAED